MSLSQNNDRSVLLKDSENEAIFEILGRGNQAKHMLWEQEIYNQLVYNTPREYFHTFETDDCQAGLNFASDVEGAKFKRIVENKIFERHRRRIERKRQRQTIEIGSTSQSSANVPSNKDGNRKITKEEISKPRGFRHVSHVDWDPRKGFDMTSLEPEMRTLFHKVGINDNSEIDENTIEFIYNFVETNGGISALKNDYVPMRAPVPPLPKHPVPLISFNGESQASRSNRIPRKNNADFSAATVPPPPPLPDAPTIHLSADTPRSGLLESIQQGFPLRRVDRGQIDEFSVSGRHSKEDGESQNYNQSPNLMDDMAQALAREIGRKFYAIENSDSDDNVENDYNDEWDE